MKIRSIWIDGFGVFADSGQQRLSPGLTVFLGPNEAGKSTLQAFLRAMLFGFADGRSNEPQYLPLRGGQHGGRLELLTDAGRALLLQRGPGPRGGRVSIVDDAGTELSPTAWRALLGGVNRDVYRAVYGFGLDELQSMESLKRDDISAAIYSGAAGAGLAGLPEARRSLSRQRENLYAPRGRKPLINGYFKELDEVRGRLAEAAADAAEYRALAARRERAQQQEAALCRLSAEISARLSAVRRSLEIWPEWIRCRSLEDQLAALPLVVGSLEPDASSQLDSFLGRLQAAREERDRRVVSVRALEAELARIRAASRHEGGAPDIDPETALHELPQLRDQAAWIARRLADAQAELARQEQVVAAACNRLADAPPRDLQAERFDAEVAERLRCVRQWRRDAEVRDGLARQVEMLRHRVSRQRLVRRRLAWCFRGLGLGVVAGALLMAVMSGEPTWWPLSRGVLQTGLAGLLLWGCGELLFGLGAGGVERLLGGGGQRELGDLETAWQEATERLQVAAAGLGEDGAGDINAEAVEANLLKKQGLHEDLRREQRLLQACRERWQAAETDVAALRRSVVRYPALRGHAEAELVVLAERLQQEMEGARNLVTLRQEREGLLNAEKQHLQGCEKQVEELEKEVQAALAAAGVESVEAFRQAARLAETRREVQQGAKAAWATVKAGIGSADDTQVRNRLQETNQDALESQRAQSARELDGLDAQRDQLRQEIARLDLTLAGMADADTIARLRQEEQGALETIRDAARRWAVCAAAETLLAEAQRRYETERQPGVVRDAAKVFCGMTRGRYTQLFAPLGEERIEVVQKDGKRRGPEELSRGTAEQLFLSLRMAYALNQGTGSESFPLVLDEVLVNFDPRRRAAAVEALVALSAERQIVYFTCHPGTAAQFAAASRLVEVVALQDGAFVPLAQGVETSEHGRTHA